MNSYRFISKIDKSIFQYTKILGFYPLTMNEAEIRNKIIQIVQENNSNPKGITKSELARIFVHRWGSSKNTIWDHIFDLIDSGEIELRKVAKQQHALFPNQ